MEIPNKVRIGYKTYKVNMIGGDLVDGNKVCYGTIKFDDGDINISKLYSKDQQQCTFIHECLHGIDDIVEAELSEDQIRKLGKGIYAFIKDNPDIFIQKNKIDVVSYDPYVVKEQNNIDIEEIVKEVARKISDSLKAIKK